MSQDQCANCLNDVGASLGKNEYGRPICLSCARGTTAGASATGDLGDQIMGLDKKQRGVPTGTKDMGDLVIAALDAEKAHIHQPQPKIETYEQAREAIRKFEKGDAGDRVVASMLRDQFRIYEALR